MPANALNVRTFIGGVDKVADKNSCGMHKFRSQYCLNSSAPPALQITFVLGGPKEAHQLQICSLAYLCSTFSSSNRVELAFLFITRCSLVILHVVTSDGAIQHFLNHSSSSLLAISALVSSAIADSKAWISISFGPSISLPLLQRLARRAATHMRAGSPSMAVMSPEGQIP